MSTLVWLNPHDNDQPFPDPETALSEPDGLLAAGGNLSVPRLLQAYQQGIFPWYSDDQPILWWSPDPRTVLLPERVRVSRSLRKTIRQGRFQVTFDRAFDAVTGHCSGPRRDHVGTWLIPEMRAAYGRLHRHGYAHSVETWRGGELVGGLYGVAIGQVFFGESMFSHRSDASKVALVALCARLREWGFVMIDCQMQTGHLLRMGAETIPRRLFLDALERYCTSGGRQGSWAGDD